MSGPSQKTTPVGFLEAAVEVPGEKGSKTHWVQLAALWRTENGNLSGTVTALPIPVLRGEPVRVVIRYPQDSNRGGRR